jgi:hypothetical protein
VPRFLDDLDLGTFSGPRVQPPPRGRRARDLLRPGRPGQRPTRRRLPRRGAPGTTSSRRRSSPRRPACATARPRADLYASLPGRGRCSPRSSSSRPPRPPASSSRGASPSTSRPAPRGLPARRGRQALHGRGRRRPGPRPRRRPRPARRLHGLRVPVTAAAPPGRASRQLRRALPERPAASAFRHLPAPGPPQRRRSRPGRRRRRVARAKFWAFSDRCSRLETAGPGPRHLPGDRPRSPPRRGPLPRRPRRPRRRRHRPRGHAPRPPARPRRHPRLLPQRPPRQRLSRRRGRSSAEIDAELAHHPQNSSARASRAPSELLSTLLAREAVPISQRRSVTS